MMERGEVAYVLGRRARQVKQRRELGEITSGHDTEGGARVTPLNVLKDVVIKVDVVIDQLAGNILPEDAGIVGGRNSLVNGFATNRPSSLSDPDGLALRSSNSLVVGIEEKVAASANAIDESTLEVRVCIHTDPVEVVNDSVVAGINVYLPCVDVTELSASEAGSSNGLTGLFDVVDEYVRLSTGVASSTVDGNTVKILGTDGDTDNQVSEGSTILGDGSLERVDLVVEGLLASGGPQSKEESSLGIDRGLDCLNDSVLSSVLDHGVKTSACPAVGAGQILCGVELVLEVGQEFGTIIIELGTVIEALDSCIDCG